MVPAYIKKHGAGMLRQSEQLQAWKEGAEQSLCWKGEK
jgi:hypothetical protein